jgi:hypothetical protein
MSVVADPLKSTVQNSKEMKLSSIMSRACNTQSRDETHQIRGGQTNIMTSHFEIEA